jgi:hypothetical protein
MGTPQLIGHDGHHGGTHRSSRLDRVRPGESLIAFPAMAAGAWTLLVAVFASVSRVFGPEGERGTWGEVVGAALGNFVIVFGLTFAVSLVLRFAGHGRTGTPERPADWGPPAPPDSGERIGPTGSHRSTQPRRVARGAAFGALPGLAIAVVPLLLHQFGVISSDQSQIGFIGLPILIVGTLVGTVVATSGSEGAAVAVLGCVAGFAVGLAVGASVAVATGVPGVWLALVPLGMMIGATFATFLRGRRVDRRSSD